ncbi:MAG TPA: PAS domain-containing protein, partial [Blastocatellia bacterium]|nr:PAS domain-containing protein [Blastocatellia bacterium]
EPPGWTIAQPATEPAPPEPEPVMPEPVAPIPAVEIPVAQARLQRATGRVADALMSPRRVRDVVRATVGLLSDGLATDRCYAIEVEGLHPQPVEHEKRSEAASSAIGVDFGDSFVQAVRSRVGQTITAISLDANSGQLVVPEHAAVRLGPVSRMIVPVLEKGRIVVVYVAEWIDLAKKLTNADVTFAEQVVARSAVARERVLQFDALAEQAAHARAEQEQMADALEQLQSLVAASPEALIGLDDEGNVAFANPAAARLLGRMEFELMGRPMHAVASVLQGRDPATWERVLSADSAQSFHAAFQHDGCSIDVSVVPGLSSSAFSRLISLREIRATDAVRGE